jgi:hypothetical protein
MSSGNVVGMKDSSGDLTQTEEFIRRNRAVGFRVMWGKDTLIYAGLCIGAVGAVCCTANFLPGLVCSIYNAFVAGDFEASREAQFAMNPIRLSRRTGHRFLWRLRIWKSAGARSFPSVSAQSPVYAGADGRNGVRAEETQISEFVTRRFDHESRVLSVWASWESP